MQDSEFENPTEGSGEGSKALSADPTATQIVTALNQGDHVTAGNLLRGAIERSPDDKPLLRLAARQRRQAERFTRVDSLLKETREAIEGDEFVRAVGAFREAANLSQGLSGLEEATFQVGIDEAGKLGDRNWRIAKALLEDAERLNPKLVVPEQRWKDVKAAEREETIANVLEETALAKPAELGRARERLIRTLEQYPEDAGLANRLKSIEATIEDKRKWDERQRCLKKLTELRDAMQREEDPAQAGKYIPQGEALAAPYSAEPEFESVVEEIRHQVFSSQRAALALKQDRIEDCLEECAWVLSRMRQHQLFLNLKKKAEEREVSLADEYSNSVSRVKELLAAGELAEAEELCTKATTQFPQFADFKELKQEIETRRLKEDRRPQENTDEAWRLVERGERSLREKQYKLAEQFFGGALKLLPEDKKLTEHLVGLLHGCARSVVRDSAQWAEEVLQLTARILPGTVIPADLAQAVRRKRQQAKDEVVRWSSLDKIEALDARVKTAKKRDEIDALRKEVEKGRFASSSHEDVREAAIALFAKIDSKAADFERKQARRPAIYRAVSIAATVVIGIGLAYWLNNRPPTPVPETSKALESAAAAPQPNTQPATGSLVIRSEIPGVQVAIGGRQYTVSGEPLKVELNADSYQVSGSRQGYRDFGPVTVAVGKAAETVLDVKLTPLPASLEIRGAQPGTQIKLDGVLLGKAGSDEPLTLPAGDHAIELSRKGFVPKGLTRNLAPGESVVLSGTDLQLESSDAQLLSRQPSFAAVETAAAKSPSSSSRAAEQAKEELQWQAVDKNNPDALRAFANQHPTSPWSNEAKQQMETILVAREATAEDGDWNSADHSSRAALEDFLKRHPNGHHAAAASNALADVDRRARLEEMQIADEAAWKKVNPHDEASIEAYLRNVPAGHYRNSAEEDLANIRMNRDSQRETAAVLTVISRLANAWSARDLDSILALQRNLKKREVKAELSHVKEINMQISPASPPQIEGTQAVVLCRRQASQIFSDGTRKQIPESIVSYVLAKHDGNWTIEGTK
jgi:tetratricopeptide (TPR) repeat protein